MLRTRLFLNLVPFLVILLAVGLYAISLFARLAANVDTIVMKNYHSVVAAQRMDQAAGRVQSGVILVFEGLGALGQDVFVQYKTNLLENLRLQILNSTQTEENDLTRELAFQCTNFMQGAEEIFAETNKVAQRQIYDDKFYPAFSRINRLVRDIQDWNHQAILATKESTDHLVGDVTRLMVIGLAVALIIASYACFALGKSILNPIQSLTKASRQLGAGQLEAPVPVTSKDELGELALAFNKMAAQLQAYRQSTTEKLLRLHRIMETTLASFTDPIFVLNREGKVELKNEAARSLAARLDWGDELPPRLQALVRPVLTSEKNHVPNDFKEAIHFHIDKENLYFLPRVLAMKQEKGPMMGVALALYEITRFRLLNDMKTNLVATVSHELKTPLTSIRMALHLLLEKPLGKLNPKQEDLVLTAREDAERLLRILNDLLDLASLEIGMTELRLESVAPEEMIRQSVSTLRDAAKQAAVTLEVSIDLHLPNIAVDLQRISLVMQNLLSNAIKYAPPGSVVKTRARAIGTDAVEFSVRDQGPGIPPAYRNQVFERFFRAPDQNKSGAGLGLSIAREIVLAHKGRIGLRTPETQGCEFFFVLPVPGHSLRKESAPMDKRSAI